MVPFPMTLNEPCGFNVPIKGLSPRRKAVALRDGECTKCNSPPLFIEEVSKTQVGPKLRVTFTADAKHTPICINPV